MVTFSSFPAALAALVLFAAFATSTASPYPPTGHQDTHRLTNAQLFAQGLPPMAPSSFVRHAFSDGRVRMVPSRTRSAKRQQVSMIVKVSGPTLTADQLAGVIASTATLQVNYLNSAVQASLAFSAAVGAAYAAAVSSVGLGLNGPALEAQQVFAKATALAAYSACVTFREIQQAAITAAEVSADPANSGSISVVAAKLAQAVKSNADAGNDAACNAVAEPYLMAYTPQQAQSAASNTLSLALAAASGQINQVTPAAVVPPSDIFPRRIQYDDW